ncbi:hypothetical protein [Kribbella deserti]|uniref:Uncharacterized protein n=1 Tax=Kribbella deserti TaxID=1926257 RepID=A0ABV6QF51_9ACTN
MRIGGILAVGAISEQAARLSTPTGGEPVTVRNIALPHTSFLRPEKTVNGVLYYQFEVIVIAGRTVMDHLEEVT